MPEIAAVKDALDGIVAESLSPGLAAVVATPEGVVHASAHGERALGSGAPMTTDSVFRIFSMTKAIGTAALMKLVEEGRVSLDAPVEEVLPEFREVQVLDGWDGDAPRLRQPRTVCTLRHLATHTSGLAYDVWHAGQDRYMKAVDGIPTLTGRKAALGNFPMHFDPGTAWAYGVSTDWLGLAVEELAGERIDAFLKREIFEPLGMASTDVAFSPDMASRRVAVHAATPEGWTIIDMDLPAHPEFHGMGHALNSTAEDYARFCAMILGGGALDGARVLSEESVATMSANGIGDLRLEPQRTTNPGLGADIDLFPEIDKTYTVGFMRNEADVPGRRRAGSLSWAGVMNTHYWIDPAAGVTGVLMMQHLPFVDPNALAAYDRFERAVYSAR